MSDDVKATAAGEATFLILGVFRRDLVQVGTANDEGDAREQASAAVLQSKFSSAFVLPILASFHEGQVNWANPDGVKHEPAQGAPLNPLSGEQEAPASEKEGRGSSEVSKAEMAKEVGRKQIADGSAIDTGEPDRLHHQRTGGDINKTSAFDGPAEKPAPAKGK